MYRSHKKHLYYPLLGILLITYTLWGVAWGINTIAEGFIAPLSVTIGIDARASYGDCKYVTAQSVGSAFVPTKTAWEWDRFKNYRPSTIRVAACGYNQCTAAGQAYDVAKVWWNACNANDRIICTGDGIGYTWSMCNVGTNLAWDYGYLYQWWRGNAPFTPWSMPWTVAWPQWAWYNGAIFVTRPSAEWWEWRSPADGNVWGWNGTTNTSWTYESLGRPWLMAGPCPAWYHVPTAKEWCDTLTALWAWSVCSGAPPYQESIANNVANTIVQSYLAIPYAWSRVNTTAIHYWYNDAGMWTSSPYWWRSIVISIRNTWVVWYYHDDRGDSFSIRCIRND